MARRALNQNGKIMQGRGKGHGSAYKPYLTVRDVPSKGLAHRIKGYKTDRIHHFLSLLEDDYFYLLDWSPMVIDVREQFPLPLDETMDIAKRLGVKHPTDPKEQQPVVMTTDFLLDVMSEGETIVKARSIKYAKDLSNARVMEKQEIERTYWTEHRIDWGIVTEKDLNDDMVQNIKWVYTALDNRRMPKLATEMLSQIEETLLDIFSAEPLRALAKTALLVDDNLGLKPGTSLWAVRYLIATRKWNVDMKALIATDQPLTFLDKVSLKAGE